MNSRLIVVLGMHRSGTSAITRSLQTMNVDLGDKLMRPVKGINEKGFWEDDEITAFNVKALDSVGMSWDSLRPLTTNDLHALQQNGSFSEAVTLLQFKIGTSPLYGFKDPRVAKLLTFWNPVFAQLECETSYLLTIRHPLSVVKSLVQRDGFEVEKCYLLWLEHVLNSLQYSLGKKRVIVDYDRLLRSPELELQRVATSLHLEIDPTQLQAYKDDFIDHTLRHTTYYLEDLASDDKCPSLVQEVYNKLLAIARDETSLQAPEFQKQVAEWLFEFEKLNPLLSLADELYINRQELNAKLVEEKNMLAEKNNQINSINDRLTVLNEEIQHLRLERAAANEQISSLTQQIAQRDLQIGERDLQLTQATNILSDVQQSRSWRITKPLRRLGTIARGSILGVRKFHYMAGQQGGIFPAAQKAIAILKEEGFQGLRIRLKNKPNISELRTPLGYSAESALSVVPYYINPADEIKPVTSSTQCSIAIHLHLFYVDMLDEIIEHLKNIPYSFDLFVSIHASHSSEEIATTIRVSGLNAHNITVEPVPNRGRDIAPLIIQFGSRLTEYDIIAHIHTKKSPHDTRLANWRSNILNGLFSRPGSGGGRVAHIIERLQKDAKFIYVESAGVVLDDNGWADNYNVARRLIQEHAGLSIDAFPQVEFPEGMMFWATSKCLKEFLSIPLSYDDFPEEPIPPDGTLAHALERVILIFAGKHPGYCLRLHESDSISDYRHYEDQYDYSETIKDTDTKILSYYLPQFHPTPENDEWHGKGFTEWTKVKAANPLFEGHYQQHIPHSSLGYYDLEFPDILYQQAEMMKKSGVFGQVFYHYWFSGRMILEAPARMLLAHADINMPFCFCWANENWTKKWDGNESEILLGQNYSAEDARAFIQYLIPFFRDERYIRIENRPVLFIYRPSSIPDPTLYLGIWEEECIAVGLERPYVVAVLTRGATNPADFNMDAGTERVLHDWTGGAVADIRPALKQYYPMKGGVLPYDEVANHYMEQTSVKNFTYFRSLVPIWDNTARYGEEALLLHGSTPSKFQEWLERTVEYSKTTLPSDRRFVLVNAWNEWAEGAHLEPDSRYGYSYLNAVGRALSHIDYSDRVPSWQPLPTGIRLHLDFQELASMQIGTDADVKHRLIHCIRNSTLLRRCAVVSCNTHTLDNEISGLQFMLTEDAVNVDFAVCIRYPALFDEHALERMASMAFNYGSSEIISNNYSSTILSATSNGATSESSAYRSPLLVSYATGRKGELSRKNICVCPKAYSFPIAKNTKPTENIPVVTTIVRFHKSGDFSLLRNALLSLLSMQDCFVTPHIAAQDLTDSQKEELHILVDSLPWNARHRPTIQYYESEGGAGDLRAKMLHDSLQTVKTRYACFLDFDDLLFPHAYSWLIQRLETTGKAVAFGRVYSTEFDHDSGMILRRNRSFEYGYTYNDFIKLNHAPIHSFMLDLHRLDVSNITYYEDQRFMEDYLMTLQIFTRKNADWDGLKQNIYVGDYIHSVNRTHTLALTDENARQALLQTEEYKLCESRINEIRKKISAKDSRNQPC